MLDAPLAFPLPLLPSVLLFAAMGGLSAVLVNRGVSVWHDGLRPLIPSLRSGEMPRKEVSRISFNLALAFIWAFGLPYSVGFVIPLAYLVFIATDWIGVSLPASFERAWYQGKENLTGVAGALVLGGAWGAGMALLLHSTSVGMDNLPVPMAAGTQLFTAPVLEAFFLFAVLTIGSHYGIKAGLVSAAVASITWFLAAELELERPGIWAFGAAVLVMLVLLVRESRNKESSAGQVPVEWLVDNDDGTEADEDDAAFAANVGKIKRGLPLIVVLAALTGAAYNWGLLAMDPFSGNLYAKGLAVSAAVVMLAWAFAFIPMKYTTAVVTGTMATGTFLEPVVALLMPNPWWAAGAVGALRIVEVFSLLWVVRWMERLPSIRELADVMRTAIFQVMEIGFLIGGALAATAFAGTWGAAVVVGAWFINIRAKSPIMPMSLGAIAALGVGVVVNVAALVGLNL